MTACKVTIKAKYPTTEEQHIKRMNTQTTQLGCETSEGSTQSTFKVNA